jgi:hypothetical protein
MAVNNKTQGITALSLQRIAAGGVVVGSTLSLPTQHLASFLVHFGKITNGSSVGYVEIRLESLVGTFWYAVGSHSIRGGGPTAETNLSITASSGATTITVDSATGFAVGDEILIRNVPTATPTDVSGSEWNRIKGISGNVISLTTPLANTHTFSGSQNITVTNAAERWVSNSDLSAFTNLRLVLDASGGLQPVVVEAWMNRLDDP